MSVHSGIIHYLFTVKDTPPDTDFLGLEKELIESLYRIGYDRSLSLSKTKLFDLLLMTSNQSSLVKLINDHKQSTFSALEIGAMTCQQK